MPIPDPPPPGIGGSGLGISTIAHSVVRNIPAMDAAFSSAMRATFGRINYTGSKQILVLFGVGIVSKITLSRP